MVMNAGGIITQHLRCPLQYYVRDRASAVITATDDASDEA